VLGSGLGGFADKLEDATYIPYTDLAGFPEPGVEGHAGRLVVGRIGGVPVACLQGRVHVYEGQGTSPLAIMIRTLAALGTRLLVLTNASGAIDPAIAPGAIAVITDHINMLGTNPLTGPNDERIGPRFPDMTEVYDTALRQLIEASGEALGLDLAHGVYLATPGPSFETPAEIRAFRALGADLVGMSTVPEAILARHAGLRRARPCRSSPTALPASPTSP
jgi:xanthosine phosphorylase